MVAIGFVAFSIACVTLLFAQAIPTQDLVLRVRMLAENDTCCAVTVEVNDGLARRKVALVPGETTVAEVPFEARSLDHVELDFEMPPGTAVRVSPLQLVSDGEVVDVVSRSDLHSFVRENVIPAQVVQGTVRFTAETAGPRVYQRLEIPATTNPISRWWWTARDEPFQFFLWGLFASAAIVAVAGVRSRLPAWAAPAAAAVAVLATRALPEVARTMGGRDSARRAVGASAYFGAWKAPEVRLHLLVAVAMCLCGALIAAVAIRWSRSGSAGTAPSSSDRNPTPLSRAGRVVLVLVVLVPVALLVPDPRAALAAAQGSEIQVHWDVANVSFWAYLVDVGAVPMRDFWYPYGLQYLLDTPVPGSLYARLLIFGAPWLALGWGTWLVLRSMTSPLLRTVAVLAGMLLALASVQGSTYRPERYLFGLAILVLYAGTLLATSSVRGRAAIAGLVLLALLLEPAQVAYAAPALVLVWGVDLLRLRGSGSHWFRGRLVQDLATFLGPAVVAIVVLAVQGQLRGTFEFYGHLSSLTAYAAVPSGIADWVGSPDDVAGLVYWAGMLPLCLGVLGLVRSGRGDDQIRNALVLGVGMLSMLLLQKHVTRPGIHYGTWMPLVFGLLLWMGTATSLPRMKGRWALCALVGAVAGLITVPGNLGGLLTDLVATPIRAASATAVVTRDDDFERERRTRWSLERFARWTRYAPAAAELRRVFPQPDARVWVLGDDPLLLAMAGEQEPYIVSNSYDASPVHLQNRIVRQLESDPPDVVVWRPTAAAIDGVAYHVRNPILYAWAAESLIPTKTVGEFEFLRLKAADEEPAIEWWRARLGPTVGLGHLMAIASPPGAACDSTRPGCSKYLEVTFEDDQRLPPEAEVVTTVAGHQFVIRFNTVAGQRKYLLNLDRLWYWNLGGTHRSVDSPTAGGGRVRVLDRISPPDVLY